MGQESEKETEVAKRLTLIDLAPRTMLVPIKAPDGEEYEVALKMVSETELDEINATVPEPQPKVIDHIGRDGKQTKERLTEDPEYLAAVKKANNERTYRTLAAVLVMDIPGDTFAQKAESLRKNGVMIWAFRQIMDKFSASLGMDVDEVQKRVESFHES
jgi:hypothetical protein